ncbi:leucine-rich repeat-containing protein 59 isoform X1 [Heterocephalus glaber]|uniref:Leucine-rich repeat-containing protein 59 n=1 Tax=Heterocephalus glaber TaxID=10181 RepID=A0AAX6REF9_HETGA|nr:leucine-rich repeat-containing protein 59 isoform X1 [Heterocephalus glaber]
MTKSGSKGGNLRDKLDGNELDLSLSDLNEVPVKELAALPKATILDLSCNKLSTLPSDFCGLTHLVKLDLSKNKLQQLPSDFGRLVNLQHLDLLNNRLVTLPVSFAQLKNLKWLDLKDNPLDPVLAKVAGDCLDEKQCKQCANKVLQHMKAVQADQERERQRRLEVEREAEKKREAKQRAKEAQEREVRKREKAEEKERRKKEYDALKASKREQEKKPKKEANQAPSKLTRHCKVPALSLSDAQTTVRPVGLSRLGAARQGPRESKSGSRPRKPPPRKQARSWAVLKLLLLLLLLCVGGGLVACRLTALQQQPLCATVNTIYDNAVQGLRRHEILRWVLQPDSQQ